MRDKHDRASAQGPADAGLKDSPADVGVHGAERVVQQIERRAAIHSAGQADALPLPARQVDAALANLRLIAGRQHRQVCAQRAHVQHVVVVRLVVGLAMSGSFKCMQETSRFPSKG